MPINLKMLIKRCDWTETNKDKGRHNMKNDTPSDILTRDNLTVPKTFILIQKMIKINHDILYDLKAKIIKVLI